MDAGTVAFDAHLTMMPSESTLKRHVSATAEADLPAQGPDDVWAEAANANRLSTRRGQRVAASPYHCAVVVLEVLVAVGIVAFVVFAWLRMRKGRWRAPDAPPFPDYGGPGGSDC